MRPFLTTLGATLGLTLSLPAMSQDVANTSARLTCNVSGLYADGARIQGNGTEDISIDIQRANPNVVDIRVSSNGRMRAAALLRSTPERVAFTYASDALVDGIGQTLALTYEIRLDQLRLKRTVMTLFSRDGNAMQTTEGNCVRAGATPGQPAATAAATAKAGPAPDWVVELRRKLKECGTKDPFSQTACNERMKARYCANRPVRVPECDAQ